MEFGALITKTKQKSPEFGEIAATFGLLCGESGRATIALYTILKNLSVFGLLFTTVDFKINAESTFQGKISLFINL